MKLVAMNIPDDPARLPGWLEQHLVGLDLAALVLELLAVQRSAGQAPVAVTELLGDRLTQVLQKGLTSLPPDILKRLLRQPQSLLELQALILTQGGAYWAQLPASAEIDHLARQGEQRLADYLARPAAKVRPVASQRPWYQ